MSRSPKGGGMFSSAAGGSYGGPSTRGGSRGMSNNRGYSSNSGASNRGMNGGLYSSTSHSPPGGMVGGASGGLRLIGSPGRSTGASLAQQRSLLPKPDGNLCNYRPPSLVAMDEATNLNSSYQCNTDRLTGYDYCLRHILCDKNAPFKPCGYCTDGQTGLKCSRPAPCYNRGDSYCAQHTKVILSARQSSSKKRKSTSNILLEHLSSYKKTKVEDGGSSSGDLNIFQQRLDPEAEGLGLAALEGDGIQLEKDNVLIGDTWTGGEGESEGESVDSEGEDSLQLAGVYTVEEVMRILKDKLVKLQKLYIDQFQRLVFKMKESRREYLVQLRQEKEAGLINISDHPNRDMEYERLKAMMHYFSPSGREALLATKHREKRLALSGTSSKQSSFCQHTLTTTTKCNGPCVPMARYCQKHILEEQGQVLYRACGVVTPADGPCETPVTALFPHTTCIYHTKVPSFDFSEKTDNIEDGPPNNDENLSTTNNTDIPANELDQDHIKTEIKTENEPKTEDLSLFTSQNYTSNKNLIKSEKQDSEFEVTSENPLNHSQNNPLSNIISEKSLKSTEIKDQPMEITNYKSADLASKDVKEAKAADVDINQSITSSNNKDNFVQDTPKKVEFSEPTANPVCDTSKEDKSYLNENIIESEKEKPAIKTTETVESISDIKVKDPEKCFDEDIKATDTNEFSKKGDCMDVENTTDHENVEINDHNSDNSESRGKKETDINDQKKEIVDTQKETDKSIEKVEDKGSEKNDKETLDNKSDNNEALSISKPTDENLTDPQEKISENEKEKEEIETKL